MKRTIIMLAIFSFIGLNAQEKPKEILKESQTKTIKVKMNGKVVEKKIVVSTTKTNDVALKASDSDKTNQSRDTNPAVKVQKDIMVDNDDDMAFDEMMKYSYIDYNGKVYDFEPMNNGFAIETHSDHALMANARKSINKDFYMINTDNYSGIGYFKGNKFVIEYYDKEEDILVIEEYNRDKVSSTKMKK